MPIATASPTFGTTVSIGAAVADVISVNVDGLKLNTIDVTTLADRHRKFVAGLIDSGTISMEVNILSAHSALWDQLDNSAASTAPSALGFTLSFGPSGSAITATGSCFVTDFSMKGGLDSALTASFTMKITGAVTLA